MPDMPQADAQAPEFTLRTDADEEVSLEDFRGRKVVLYFYPKDDTPGCTKEACAFRDAHDEYEARGVTVLGVSPDTVASHRKFRSKYDLPFTLLADPDHEVAERYGVWKEKSMYGRTYMGVDRTTFLIDEEGRIAKVFPKVRPEGHAAEILGAVV